MGDLGCFQSLSIGYSTSVNMGVQVISWSTFSQVYATEWYEWIMW
jgi:hypothetical protein